MNDEERLQIEVEDEGHLVSLAERLDAQELEDELGDAFADRVILSREGPRIFAYAETREQAEAVRSRVLELDEEQSWSASTELRHWHPVAASWEEPDVPLPESDAAVAAEHAEAIAAERERLAETGEPEYEVRVELQQLELQAPSGSGVSAEASGRVAWAERPSNPFAIFGGLGG